MSLLGIDVGTSGCKALIFSEDGSLLSAAYAEYDTRHPRPGWAELDSRHVWELVQATIRRAVRSLKGDAPRALCVSSLGEAFVPVNAAREILGPSLLNFDERGAEFLPDLRARLNDAHLYRINGNTLGNHYSLPKLLWLRQHQPDVYRRTDWFLHWSGFVSFMLGADPAVDASLANRSLLFDLQRADWSAELLDWAQLDPRKLPPVVAGGTQIGAVSRTAADELGLPAGMPILIGAHDQCCTAVGCGVTRPGQAVYGMGTYICMTPVFDQRPDDNAMITQGLNTEHHAVSGQYVCFIYNQGGALVKWYRDTFAAAERKQALDSGADPYPALFAEMPAGPSRVMVLPHFTASGPPHFITDSCGLLAGLHLDTPRGEILKGIIEGATFYLRECLESLPEGISIRGFRAAGGGSRSDAWLQLSADILGRPLVRAQASEAGALGAAVIAGVGSRVFTSIEEGVQCMVRTEREFQPDPQMQARYAEQFAKYQQLWPLMQDYLRGLAAPTA